MIFVTVGTHEQPFDRLVQEIDRLKAEKLIPGEVFIQTGYSSYKPVSCEYNDFIRFDEMMGRMEEADIVVTHGGTGSIMLVLYHGKIPVVVPRQKKYREHIDDHQVLFCKAMAARGKIIAVYETGDLGPALTDYHRWIQSLQRPVNQEDLHPGPGLRVNPGAAFWARELNEICQRLGRKK